MYKMKKIITAGLAGFMCLFALGGVTVRNNLIFSQPRGAPIVEITPIEDKIEVENAYPVYALNDTVIYASPTLTSGVVRDVKIGEEIYVYNEYFSENNIRYYICADGFIKHLDFIQNKEYVFYPIDKVKYAKEYAVLLDEPNNNGAIAVSLELNDEVRLNGYNCNNYYRYADEPGLYISSEYLMDSKYIPPTPTPVPQPTYHEAYTPSGSGHLTPSAGVFYGPSGKETYYNLNMSGVISIAQAAGIYGDYWVRSDGVKMYGSYIMCACGFSVRPRGTLVETSLGTGICLDTGGFAENDPYQIDIAVTW